MEQEGTNLIESQGTDNSPTPEGPVVQEPSNQIPSEIQEALNTVAQPKMMEQKRDPFGRGSMATIFEQQRTLGLGSIAKMVDQQRTALDLGSISKIIEQQRTLGLGSIAKMVDQQRTVLDLGSMAKIIEQQRSALGLGSIAKMVDQQRTAMDLGSMAKIIEQQRTPLGLGSIAKMLEQQHNAHNTLGLGSMAKIIEQQRSALGHGSIARMLENQNNARNALGLGSIAKMLEQQHNAHKTLSLGSMAKIIEQQRSTLGFGSIAKAMDNLSSHASSALARASLENLLDELQERTAEASPSNLVVAPKLKGLTLEIASDALENKDLQPLSKSRKLSPVPTWILIALIHTIILSAYVLENWDAIRLSIVDINARMPNTETFSEARKFIRTELAGKPGDVRLVSGTNVNLREDPGMKSRIILSLPKNSPVIVLGKEDRTWLLVSYEHQGYWIEGYISTKHLKRIRKDLSSR
ncbi:SH3 domain-containing protein [Pseudomonas sp. URIL14HWK12:I7]|uniref:SH3 domain-containing protein n=1 Tax=Pseudomonas sp. URIL14HWK12:I7 TaxID=1283285 RepID=UPI00048A0054|nr:SH3 domain-containing protein [Pseudomonas sp. URIL14HWK12:I7]